MEGRRRPSAEEVEAIAGAAMEDEEAIRGGMTDFRAGREEPRSGAGGEAEAPSSARGAARVTGVADRLGTEDAGAFPSSSAVPPVCSLSGR